MRGSPMKAVYEREHTAKTWSRQLALTPFPSRCPGSELGRAALCVRSTARLYTWALWGRLHCALTAQTPASERVSKGPRQNYRVIACTICAGRQRYNGYGCTTAYSVGGGTKYKQSVWGLSSRKMEEEQGETLCESERNGMDAWYSVT